MDHIADVENCAPNVRKVPHCVNSAVAGLCRCSESPVSRDATRWGRLVVKGGSGPFASFYERADSGHSLHLVWITANGECDEIRTQI